MTAHDDRHTSWDDPTSTHDTPVPASTGGRLPDVESATTGTAIRADFPLLVQVADLALDDPVLKAVPSRPGDDLTHAWLRRSGATTVGELLDLRRQDLLAMRGFGPTKVRRVLEYLARLAESVPMFLAWRAQKGCSGSSDTPTPASPTTGEEENVEGHLRTVIGWAVSVGGAKTWADALQLTGERLPTEVDHAFQRLLSSDLPVGERESPVADFLEEDPRAARILLERVLDPEPRRLQDLADEFAVSRERVRQLESKTLARLEEAFATASAWRTVRWAAERLQNVAGSFAPSTVVEEALPGWSSEERRVIARLAGFRWTESLLVRADLRLPDPHDVPLLEGTTYVIDEFELVESLSTLGVLPDYLDFAVGKIGSTARVDGQLVLWRGSAVDKVVAVLEVRDAPQGVDRLVLEVTGESSSRSLRNRILEDPRLIRVTKTKVGLRRWGGAMYTGVAALMRDRLTTGPMDLDDLARELADRYEVSAASVRMYSAAPVFKVTDDTIALRSQRDPYVPRNNPPRVKGLYRDRASAVTVWCLTVDKDMVRGSGRALPSEVAVDLGVGPGERVDVLTAVGAIPISWSETSNAGPNMGSVRELLEAVGADIGDDVAFRFHSDEKTLDLRVLADAGSAMDPAEALAARTSLPVSLTSRLQLLAAAIDVETPALAAALAARGDIEVSALTRALAGSTGHGSSLRD